MCEYTRYNHYMNNEIITKLQKAAARSAKDVRSATSDAQRQHAKQIEHRALAAIDMINHSKPADVAWRFFQTGEIA